MKSVYWYLHTMILNLDVETIVIMSKGEVLEHCAMRFGYIMDKYGTYRVKSMVYDGTELTLEVV